MALAFLAGAALGGLVGYGFGAWGGPRMYFAPYPVYPSYVYPRYCAPPVFGSYYYPAPYFTPWYGYY